MKRFILALCCLIALTAFAASSDWYLYFWSDTYSLDSDVARFQTTDDADIFLVKSVNVPASGFNFGVHNADWSTTYGWKDAAVTATDVEVGLAASDQANGWLALPAGDYSVTFDAVNLTVRFADPVEDETPEEQPAKFLLGGDLSMATYVEDWGAKFYYQDGTQGDLFDILQAYGVNLARLRVYNEPGTAVNDGGTIYRTPIMSSKYPNGYPYAGQDDILHLAKRAKDHKMAICLSIYLSDYWSGATCQMIPEAWNTATTLEGLGDSVYNYVHRYMTRMKDQETLPEFVSVGNDIPLKTALPTRCICSTKPMTPLKTCRPPHRSLSITRMAIRARLVNAARSSRTWSITDVSSMLSAGRTTPIGHLSKVRQTKRLTACSRGQRIWRIISINP